VNQPEWDPVVVVDKALRPSGPIPVCVVLSEPRDHAMSPLGLAPSLAAQRPETPGHGMEIPMTFWCAMRNMGPSFGSYAWIPMGARCGTHPTPNSRTSGHAKVRKAAGTVTREPDREFISPCAAYICLTRAFSWAHHNCPRRESTAPQSRTKNRDRPGSEGKEPHSGVPSLTFFSQERFGDDQRPEKRQGGLPREARSKHLSRRGRRPPATHRRGRSR